MKSKLIERVAKMKSRYIAIINDRWDDECEAGNIFPSSELAIKDLRRMANSPDLPDLFEEGDSAVIYRLVPISRVEPVSNKTSLKIQKIT